jgi:CO/xanthine dehydrogenase Mo-binding subunit
VTPDASVGLDTARLAQMARDGLEQDGETALTVGNVDMALAEAASVVEAQYEVPYLAHVCMEPMVATAHVTAAGCEIWLPTQGAYGVRAAVADVLDIAAAQVTVHRTYLGTGFGRKIETDYALHAALAAKAVGAPVQVIWSREEALQHDFYRPGFAVRFRGGLDAEGQLVGWDAKAAGESILLERGLPLPVDPVSVDGLVKINGLQGESLPYAIPHQRVTSVQLEAPIPVGFWRSVGNSQHAFFVESFMDELASAAGVDPLAFRRQLLAGQPRYLAVLDRLAVEANWGSPTVAGAGQGLAFSYAYESVIAMVAEATVARGRITVHQMTCVVDCGTVVNPDHVKAQIEGGVIFGLGPALDQAIRFENGRVVQSNFHDYPMPLMADVPPIATHLIASDAPPGGVGELSVGPVAPAIANAIFAASGDRLRQLPLHRTLAGG